MLWNFPRNLVVNGESAALFGFDLLGLYSILDNLPEVAFDNGRQT